jgi:hypothetical protein
MHQGDIMIQNGDKVRDRITGFEGIVIGVTDWLYQCRRPIVQPMQLTSDGKIGDSQSFDEDQLEVIEAGAFALSRTPTPEVRAETRQPEPTTPKTGGPRDVPSRQPEPRR